MTNSAFRRVPNALALAAVMLVAATLLVACGDRGLQASSGGQNGPGGIRKCSHHRCPVPSLVFREAEVDAAVAGVEPAGGDGFGAGEEVDAFGAVGVGVAEQ